MSYSISRRDFYTHQTCTRVGDLGTKNAKVYGWGLIFTILLVKFFPSFFAPAVSGQQPVAGQSAHLLLRLVGLDLLLQGTALQQ
jgi:hypothetical protein